MKSLTILLAYKALHRRMVIEMVKFIVLWISNFPDSGGGYLSPSVPGKYPKEIP